MKHIFKFIFVGIVMLAFTAKADLYTVSDVEMSGKGDNAVEAKNNAISSGELTAFNQMITGLIGSDNVAFFEHPEDNEILSMVRDISISEEKKTDTSYWGKMNVRFKEEEVKELLQKSKQNYLKKASPIYWLVPIWKQGADVRTLEDENPFYQTLKNQNKLSDTFQMILPDGDINELIMVEQAMENGDFSALAKTAIQNRAERILLIQVSLFPDNSWEMKPISYEHTENIFDELMVQGTQNTPLLEGWQRLNQKMMTLWQSKNVTQGRESDTYYARINLPQISVWGDLENEFNKLEFLENLTLQGAMPGQLLIRFDYSHGIGELIQQFNKAGWIWETDSGTLGTLERKKNHENIL